MRINGYLFFLCLINTSAGASILQTPQKVALIARGFSFLQGLGFALLGWGFLLAGLLCLLTFLLWWPVTQRFLPAWPIRALRISAQGLSLCVLCAWAMIALLETLFLGASVLGTVILACLVWMEALEIKWPDLTPARERQVLDLFKQKGV